MELFKYWIAQCSLSSTHHNCATYSDNHPLVTKALCGCDITPKENNGNFSIICQFDEMIFVVNKWLFCWVWFFRFHASVYFCVSEWILVLTIFCRLLFQSESIIYLSFNKLLELISHFIPLKQVYIFFAMFVLFPLFLEFDVIL